MNKLNKITLSSFIGNSIEYYDFLVYGTVSALLFPQIFFPDYSPFAGVLISFATFGVGFIARPLGSLFFGHKGDTKGRKQALVRTILLMGISTFLIGLLPTFEQVGIVAPLLLVLLRFLQGFSVGGEWGGAMLMVLENAPSHRRAFFSALPNTGGFSAQLLSMGIFSLITLLPDKQLYAWGWRLPFLVSAILVVIGLYFRRTLDETPLYVKLKENEQLPDSFSVPEKNTLSKRPLLELIRNEWKTILLMFPLRFAEAMPFFIVMVFTLSYATKQLAIDKSALFSGIIVASLLAFPSHALFGALSDRVGRKPIYMAGALVVALSAFPFFYMLETKKPLLIMLGYVLMINFGHNALNAVQPAWFTELFNTRVRYSGAAVGREFSSIFVGFTPFIAASLVAVDNGGWTWVATYLTLMSLATAVTVFFVRETYKNSIG